MDKKLLDYMQESGLDIDGFSQDPALQRAFLNGIRAVYKDVDEAHGLPRLKSGLDSQTVYSDVHECGLFELVMNSVPDLIYCKDVDGVYMGGNRAFADFVNCTGGLAGKTDEDFLQPDVAVTMQRKDQLVLDTDAPSMAEESWVDSHGGRTMMEVYRAPFHDAAKVPVGTICVGHDITRRKHLEENLMLKYGLTVPF